MFLNHAIRKTDAMTNTTAPSTDADDSNTTLISAAEYASFVRSL